MILSEREVLHLPETAHLYALLNFAQIKQANYLEPELESYLIQTLLRFSEMPLQDEWCLSEADFEELKNSPQLNNFEFLKDVADYCLISSGLMADHFSSEENNYEQFQQIGMDAFSILSKHEDDKENIYIKVSHNFFNLVEILKCSQCIMHEQISTLLLGNPDTSEVGELPFSETGTESRFTPFNYQGLTYH